MATGKYRMKRPTIALLFQEGRGLARMIPAGAVISVERIDGDKLVEVTWETTKVMMLAHDVRKRGQRINEISK